MYHGWFTKWMPPKRAGKLSCRDHRIQWLVTSEKQKISYGDCCLYIHSHWKRMSSLILITFICTTELNPQVAMNEISAASFPYLLPRVHLFNRLHYATPVAKVPVLPGLCLVLLGFTQPLEADYNNWSWPRTVRCVVVWMWFTFPNNGTCHWVIWPLCWNRPRRLWTWTHGLNRRGVDGLWCWGKNLRMKVEQQIFGNSPRKLSNWIGEQ